MNNILAASAVFSGISTEWLVFAAIAIIIVTIDIFTSGGKEPTLKASLWQTLFYVSVGLAFGGYVYYVRGGHDASLYYTGFIVEKTLSVDNIFVMGLIFASLGVPPSKQRTLLYLGIIGAVFFRGVFLGAGTAIVAKYAWTLYILGGLLVYMGAKIFFTDEGDDAGEEPAMAKRVKKWGLSPAIAALVAIEVTDVIFAIDSIPAILAISQDMYIVFTSNLFAILGLRSLYFCLQGVKAEFHYLPKALGLVLVLIGIKAILPYWHIHIPTAYSLIVTVGLISGAVALSLIYPQIRKEEEAAAE